MDLDILREKIKRLTADLENAIMEKGMAAEENKDLRENFAYDYWVEQEFVISAKIRDVKQQIAEIAIKRQKTAEKPVKKKAKSKAKPTQKISDLPKNKWL